MKMDLMNFLLVEDNEDHAELVSQSLEDRRIGNNIDHVLNGEEALAYLYRKGKYADRPDPDVILLDLNLPKISGLDVLKEIKADKDLRRIPVVILTTSAAESDLAKAYDYHANSYLVKPLDFEQFQKMVEDLGLYWGVWNKKLNP